MRYSLFFAFALIILLLSGCDDKIVDSDHIEEEAIVFVSSNALKDQNSVPNLYSIKLDGSALKQLTFGTDYFSFEPSVGKNGNLILFESGADGNPDIFSISADGSNIVNLTNSLSHDSEPQISDDGSFIIFKRYIYIDGWQQNSQIYKMNMNGTNQINLTNNDLFTHHPKIHPNNSDIYYFAHQNGKFALFRMDINGENQKALIDSSLSPSVYHNSYAISNDGTKIAFLASEMSVEKLDLYTMNYDGSNITRLTDNQEFESSPNFSNDDSQIIYTVSSNYGSADNTAIKIISSSGGSSQTIVEIENASTPIFNKDGDKIIFAASNDDFLDIFMINKDGSDLFNITNSKIDNFSPKIVY